LVSEKEKGFENEKELKTIGGQVVDPVEQAGRNAAGEIGRGDQRSRLPMRKWKKVLLIIAGALLLLIAALGTYVLAFFNQVQETQRVLLDDVTFTEEYDVNAVFPEHIVNIALLGFDRGWNRESYGEYLFRPDMLAILTIDFDRDTIAVVRIPRDSYVPIYNQGGFHDKINHSYYYGYSSGHSDDAHADGIRSTLLTVSNVLGGIPIHYYVSVDMYSIVELVDAMGGIYYESEQEIIDKHWEVGRVLVPKGPQIMDGKTYLRYLQYRDNATNQDYGRIDRQMNLLKETYLFLRKEGKITDIPTTYRIYKDYVETDLTYKQIAALAFYARDLEIDDESLKFFTITGDGQMKDGIWYQVVFQNRRVEIIKEVFGIDAAPWPPIVLVDSPEYLEEQERKRLEEEFGISDDDETSQLMPEDDTGEEDGDQESPEEQDQASLALVPELRGLNIAEAVSIIESLGFVFGVVSEVSDDAFPAGQVLYTEPLSGSRVEPGSVVNLVVSKESEL
jgi:polyisoprenyl-teichoic acid--peptidoglycan teichoic acid transferase